MIKSVVTSAIAVALISFGANAAPTAVAGQGKVLFQGTVVDAPCSISQKTADQSINFGQLSKSFLEAGGISKPMDLDIELANCDITQFKTASNKPAKQGKVRVTFSGLTVSGQQSELATSGDTGTAVVIQAAGQNVAFGQEGDAIPLKDGDNILHYTAVVKKATSGTVKEGAFSAIANFNLTYM